MAQRHALERLVFGFSVLALAGAGCLSDRDDAVPSQLPPTAADVVNIDTFSATDTQQPDTALVDTMTVDTFMPSDTAVPPDTIAPGSLSVTTGSWSMAPGEESTRCVVKRLGNSERIFVNQIRTSLAPGSHHLIVYAIDEGAEQLQPEPCTPFLDVLGGGVPLMISEIANEVLELPPRVVYQLEPNQLIRVEAHYLNYFPEPIEARGTVSFNTVGADDFDAVAGLLFYGTSDFDVTPGQSQTEWKWQDIPNGSKLFAMTGHTHRFGTNVEVQLSGGAGQAGQGLYPGDRPFAWDEAPVEQFEPPLSVTNTQGLRFRCTWNNTGNDTIGFGTSALDEMCFVWTYYYPSKGFRLCADLLGFCPPD